MSSRPRFITIPDDAVLEASGCEGGDVSGEDLHTELPSQGEGHWNRLWGKDDGGEVAEEGLVNNVVPQDDLYGTDGEGSVDCEVSRSQPDTVKRAAARDGVTKGRIGVVLEGNSVQRWELDIKSVLAELKQQLSIDKSAVDAFKKKEKKKRETIMPNPQDESIEDPHHTLSFSGVSPATTLSSSTQTEIVHLHRKCAELKNILGVVSAKGGEGSAMRAAPVSSSRVYGEDDIVSETNKLYQKVILMDPMAAEELSNRVDVTISAAKKRYEDRDALLQFTGGSAKDMQDTLLFTKLVRDVYSKHLAALRVVSRMIALRSFHQEAFQRMGAFAEITDAVRATRVFTVVGNSEMQEMRNNIQEIGSTTERGLKYFHDRLALI
eukprot:Tbor_TRINITY_DN5529_c0_g1::TRINITY_DN5529_c0_g1_i1::g.12916::m.12916